jgi:hypothetical protein
LNYDPFAPPPLFTHRPHMHTMPYVRISSQVGLCRLFRHDDEGTSIFVSSFMKRTLVLFGKADLQLSSTSSVFFRSDPPDKFELAGSACVIRAISAAPSAFKSGSIQAVFQAPYRLACTRVLTRVSNNCAGPPGLIIYYTMCVCVCVCVYIYIYIYIYDLCTQSLSELRER